MKAMQKEHEIDLEFSFSWETFVNRRDLSKKILEERIGVFFLCRNRGRRERERGKNTIKSIFACHRHIICRCYCLILSWNRWRSRHGIHIRRWNISMLNKKQIHRFLVVFFRSMEKCFSFFLSINIPH